jgi:hypothetical protein
MAKVRKQAAKTIEARPDAAIISARSLIIDALQAIAEGDMELFGERISAIRQSKEDLMTIASSEERERIAFRMRVTGAPLDEIAVTLQYATNADVSAAVTRERKRCEALAISTVEETVALEVCRLDLWLRAIQPAALGGSTEAVKTALLISKRRAELLGLDQPIRHSVGYMSPEGRIVSQLVLQEPDATALPPGDDDDQADG